MAGAWGGRWLLALCCWLLMLLVTGSVTDSVLLSPLLEVGHLWVSAASTLYGRVVTLLTTIPDLSDWKTYVSLLLLLAALYGAYFLLLKPLNRVRKLGDIGYIPQGSFTVKETANYVQKRRRVGTVPPVYPNGWFGVMESFYLRQGEASTVSMLGRYPGWGGGWGV